MNDSYKKVIKSIIDSRDNSFDDGKYKFGRGKPLSRIRAMVKITEMGIPEDDAEVAMVYFDKEIVKHLENKEVRDARNAKPSAEKWEDGESFPEFPEPIDIAVMLFTTLNVSSSGAFEFCKVRGVPKWMSRVNPGLDDKDRVKEHDVKAGVSAAVRRYRKERSEDEKKAQHSVTVEDIMVCRDSVTSHMRKLTKKQVSEHLAYDKTIRKEGMAELLKFVKAYKVPRVTDHSKRMVKLHMSMISHWIWQVKRRLNGDPTVYEIILVFLGRQGVGKSYSARRLTQVVGGLMTPTNVSSLVDERETRRWENYYIAFLDEVSKESKDSLSKLKEWVTKNDAEYRPLHTNATEACDKNAQAIGTSNFPLASILKDSSGMRRFWEIPSDQPKAKLFEGMEKIDWTLIYRAINESLDFGYYGPNSKGAEFHEEIENIQDATRDKSPVEEYLYAHNYVDLKGTVIMGKIKSDWFDVDTMLEDFNFWSDQNGWGKYTPKAFRNELHIMHLDCKRRSGNKLFVRLNKPEDLKKENEIIEVGFDE